MPVSRSSGIKISLSLVFAVVITGLASAVIGVVFFERALTASIRESGTAYSLHLASVCAQPLHSGKTERLRKIVNQARRTVPNLAYVFVLERSRRVLVHTFEKDVPFRLIQLNRVRSNLRTSVRQLQVNEEGVIDFATPVTYNETPIGMIRLGLSMQPIRKSLLGYVATSGAVVLLLLELGVLAGIAVRRLTFRPLAVLRRDAEAIGSGDLSRRITLRTGDEMERLGTAMDEMVANIRSKFLRLEKERDALAVRAQERTQELAKANLAIRDENSSKKLLEKELKEKSRELDKLADISAERELNMVELKKSMERLREQLRDGVSMEEDDS